MTLEGPGGKYPPNSPVLLKWRAHRPGHIFINPYCCEVGTELFIEISGARMTSDPITIMSLQFFFDIVDNLKSFLLH